MPDHVHVRLNTASVEARVDAPLLQQVLEHVAFQRVRRFENGFHDNFSLCSRRTIQDWRSGLSGTCFQVPSR